MSADYQLKKLEVKDLTQMMRIERIVFNPTWSASMMRDSVMAAHTQSWGYFEEDGETLVAYGIISVVLDEAELLTMCVDPKHQGQGLGEKLSRHLFEKAKKSKADFIFLEVRVSNEPAINLYEKLGFKQMGVRKNYYPLPGSSEREDALMLKCDLD